MKPVDVQVPDLGESITTVMVSAWLKKPGEAVALDEPLVEIESDKATVEVPAPTAGVLAEIAVDEGAEASPGDLLGRIDADGEATADETADAPSAREEPGSSAGGGHVMPAARRVMDEKGLADGDVEGSGPGGRVLKEDAERAAAGRAEPAAPMRPVAPVPAPGNREVRETPMSPIRRTIARRLVQSQREAALLTTFNEVDMTRVKALRAEHKEAFQARYGVKLGFMSFFVRAACEALREVPALNAQIRDEKTIVHHDYCDIGIAVGGGKGLVVPVIRNAEALDFGPIEQIIADFAERAAANRIELEELEGGTFTISNGGVYGSLLSTPIVNPPQSGVLGLHGIQDRPVASDGQVVIRPMMYIALTYDHRLVDGREAVTFLKHIKHVVESPERLLLKI